MRLNCKRQTPQKPNMSLLYISAKNTPFAVQVLSAFNYKYHPILKFHLTSKNFSSIIHKYTNSPSHFATVTEKKSFPNYL